MKYTDSQEKAINVRNCEVLVSAAAGSGKTSVLVERIIRRITDAQNPIDIDRMLIVTFTKAAAKEMKDRIRKAIEDRLDENPSDENCLRQSMLIHNAQITTIHGFCQSVIRDHFDAIAIDPNFRVADANELKLMRIDVLDSVLERYYEEGREEFLNTVECFSGQKSDARFADIIMKLFEFSQSHPDPHAFLTECVKQYQANNVQEFESMPFIEAYVEVYKDRLAGNIRACKKAIEAIDEAPSIMKYRTAFVNDCEMMQRAMAQTTYNDFADAIRQISFEALARILSKNIDELDAAVQKTVKDIREEYKDDIKEMQSDFMDSVGEAFSTMQACRLNVEMLVEVTESFAKEYAGCKADKNVIDFNDMEHMAISILKSSSIIADEYRDFFDEIYVDEYQDSNLTQEELIKAIKKPEPNGNLFMVGDVKQSIYRFRQARPDLFIEKYDSFTDDPSGQQRILLNDNFRSRREVISAVNEIFTAIMKRDVGNIEYDEDASLKYGAVYYPECEASQSNRAEILIGTGDDITNIEMEANIIANRIKEMVSESAQVFDTEMKQMRPVQYRDIAILLRSEKNWYDAIKNALELVGIPVASSGTKGYFATAEVQTVLACLETIDNPRQDIPLATVMLSVFGGFTNEELAIIKGRYIRIGLYDSVCDCAADEREDVDGNLQAKCIRLMQKISKYRDMSVYTPVYGLIQSIIDDGLGEYYRSMEGGKKCEENLKMLTVKALEYGKTSFSGLFNFVRYINLIRKYEIEDGERDSFGDENAVKIMTIHKSKGLEFPVCFVAGIDKRRNIKDETGSVIWDAKYGIGVDMVDCDRRIKRKTVYKNLIKHHLAAENIAEEIRVLYVAMTRAREKLILVGYSRDGKIFDKKKGGILSCSTYLDMILQAANDQGEYLHFDVSFIDSQMLVTSRMQTELVRESYKDVVFESARDTEGAKEYDVPKELGELTYQYPYAEVSSVPAKMSVSQLKHQAIEEEIEKGMELAPVGQQLFAETDPDTYIPAFMRKEGQTVSGGTFYGTAFHRIMELWRYDTTNVTEDDVKSFAAEMLASYRMSEEQVEAIRPADIAYFLNSELGKEMKAAHEKGLLRREQPFVIGIPASELMDIETKPEMEEIVLVQGIIDAYYENENGIVIVDYKTDYVTQKEMLISRYKAQLQYYAKALNQLTEKNVSKKLIYSSRLRDVISV